MSSSFFPVGSEVEVRSNEEGFKGAWFEATILQTLPKYRRCTVVYTSLLTDDVPSKPLVDSVHLSYVRPRPPRPPYPTRAAAAGSGAGWRMHHMVEAFHNDGWWKGIVSGVPRRRGGMYKVCFPSSREEFEFSGEEMRERMEWMKGSWISVLDEEGVENVMFDVGSKIEVSLDDEDYGAGWYAGTVLKVIGKCYFLVEYENRRVDDGGNDGTQLKEIVDLQYIRPSPPAAWKSDFKIFDEVEVFHLERWLAGTVMEIRSRSRCIAKLKHRAEDIELNQSAIRPHFDWINERWVHISRDRSSKPSASKKPKSTGRKEKFRTIKSLPISAPTFSKNDEVTGSEAMNLKGQNAKEHNHESEVELSQTCKTLKEETSLKEHLKLVDGTKSPVRRQRSKVGRRSSISDRAMTSSNKNGHVVDSKFGVVYLKTKKIEKLSLEDKAKSSRSSEKVSLIGCGAKSLLVAGKTSPALVDKQYHSKSPSRKRRCLFRKGKRKSESVPLVKNLYLIKDISREGGINKSITSGDGSRAAEGSVPQSVACNLDHSTAEQATNLILNGNKDNPIPNNNHIIKRRRKKVVVRAPRLRRTADIVDVKQQVQEEEKKPKRGRPPKAGDLGLNDNRKVQRENITPPSSPYQLRRTSGGVEDVKQHDQKEKEVGSRGKSPKTGNHGQNENSKVKRMKLVVQAAYELRETSDVVGVNPAGQDKNRKRSRPSMENITCMNGVKSQQLKEATELEVDYEDRNDWAKLSGPIPTVDVSDNLLAANTESNSPVHNVSNICLLNKQADIMEDSPVTSPLESSNVHAQQLSKLKCFNSRVEEFWTLTSKENEVYPHSDPDSSRPPLENVVETVKSLTDPTPSDSSPSKDGCEHNGFTPTDRISVPNQNDLAPSGSLWENVIHEKDTAQNDCTSSASSSSKDDIHEFASERALVLAEQRAEIDAVQCGSISTAMTLPFTKESLMWESVELMEIFRAMPQQPHFQPLHQYDVEFREGMAIGLMVTFANLVDSIQKLQITDPQDILEEKLKALVPLESNGFNVDFVRSRLEKLMEIRSNASYTQVQKESLREKMMEREDERVSLGSLIAAHDKVISELEENLRLFQERRSSVLSDRHTKDSEMIQLKMELQATEEAYLSAEEHFNSAVYAPW